MWSLLRYITMDSVSPYPKFMFYWTLPAFALGILIGFSSGFISIYMYMMNAYVSNNFEDFMNFIVTLISNANTIISLFWCNLIIVCIALYYLYVRIALSGHFFYVVCEESKKEM